MNEDIFWFLIEKAKEPAGENFEQRPENLRKVLAGLSADELREFDKIYFMQIIKAYRWDLWGAAYIINGGCSDDDFRYFCDFLISEGKSVFNAAIDDPETLAELDNIEDAELEDMGYIAMELYEEKSGSELPPSTITYPKDPVGEAWDEDSLENLFPKLAKKYY